MNRFVLSVDADLDEIWEYIAADNIDAADGLKRYPSLPTSTVAITKHPPPPPPRPLP